MSIPQDEVILSIKHLPDLKIYALEYVPRKYKKHIDDFNEDLKDFPQFIKTKPNILDAGLVHAVTAHVLRQCRLRDEHHDIRDCIYVQFTNWQNRIYTIASKEKLEQANKPQYNMEPLTEVSMQRIKDILAKVDENHKLTK